MKPIGLSDLLVRGVTWMVATGLLTILLAGDVTSRLDDALYDYHMWHWQYTPSSDVVIVAIDPKSMDTLGSWPWPRAVLGRLLDRLTDFGVSAIAMAVASSSPDLSRPENDHLLAQAIRRNGRVVLPVNAEAREQGGPLHEKWPIPEIASAAASLGESLLQQDPDGVARGVYLQAGLSRPYWPILPLAVYLLDHPQAHAGLRTKLDSLDIDGDLHYARSADEYVLLRYAGPTGTFRTVSLLDVLNGKGDPSIFKGKTVLIGSTVPGLGSDTFTPGLRPKPAMPSIEYYANVLEALRQGLLISPLDIFRNVLIGMAVLALPLLMYGWPGLRRVWVVAAISIAVALLASLLMLRLAYMWWPPMSVIAIVVFGAIVWRTLEPRLVRPEQP